MAARCDVCDGRVMPYSTYMIWMKPTARCDECGADVRLRGFWVILGLGAGLASGALTLLATTGTPGTVFGIVLALSGALAVMDYVSYHMLRWEADHELDVPETPLLLPRD